MNFALVVVGLALAAFPGAFASRSHRFPAQEWARVCALALTVGGACVGVGLVMTALPPLLHAVHLEGVVAICDPVVHRLMLGGPFVGWSAVVLIVLAVAVVAAAIRTSHLALGRARIELWLGDHVFRGDYELVILPTPELLAFGVPGDLPQVVVSEGLVADLGPNGLDAVVGHEVAHHRLGHRRYLVLTVLLDRTLGWLPLVRRSTDALRESLEVWADDVAVASIAASREALHDALVHVASVEDHTWASQSRGVQNRADRLRGLWRCSPVSRRGLAYLPAGALACCAAVLAAGWTLSSQHMLAVGGYC